MLNIYSDPFNSWEGLFWLLLGFVTLWVYFRVEKKYKSLALFASVILITFGLSDFAQVQYGSFLQPQLKWLLVWKIIDVIGLITVIIWYLIIRSRGN